MNGTDRVNIRSGLCFWQVHWGSPSVLLSRENVRFNCSAILSVALRYCLQFFHCPGELCLALASCTIRRTEGRLGRLENGMSVRMMAIGMPRRRIMPSMSMKYS